ncbi:GFA family protein [uncultured Sphingomonas sp.]|uniref:GFA family protein n=1 Tax=uncultured Sphingomonas sp. TaxID=158754 RepID=UPI0025CCC46A|nr:GFA family protein [uncultured Sphingomonas sp.]
MVKIMTGGCQCRRVRYSVRIDSDEAYLCHCAMCRHATGGASIAFVSVVLDGVAWQGEPAWYRSSPIAERPFCAACGTPLGFRFAENAERMDLTLGSFDDPHGFRPVHNYATESILPAWQDTSHLPGLRSDENASVVDRWMKSVGKLPE